MTRPVRLSEETHARLKAYAKPRQLKIGGLADEIVRGWLSVQEYYQGRWPEPNSGIPVHVGPVPTTQTRDYPIYDADE